MKTTSKICPICRTEKSTEEFHKYFSKQRQKYRLGNYCKLCSNSESLARAKEHYRKNKEKKLLYAKNYRGENAEKIKLERPKYKKRQIEELQDCYVRELLVVKSKINADFVDAVSEVKETRRLQIKIKRIIKSKRNGQK
jgi:hypothetical protein